METCSRDRLYLSHVDKACWIPLILCTKPVQYVWWTLTKKKHSPFHLPALLSSLSFFLGHSNNIVERAPPPVENGSVFNNPASASAAFNFTVWLSGFLKVLCKQQCLHLVWGIAAVSSVLVRLRWGLHWRHGYLLRETHTSIGNKRVIFNWIYNTFFFS